VEAWILPLSIGEPNACIVRKAPAHQTGYVLRWRQLEERQKIQLRIDRRPKPVLIAEGPSTWQLIGEWLHVAGTYDSDSGTACLFVNGHLTQRSDAEPGYYPSTEDLTIGGFSKADGEGFFGVIRQVRLSARVLYKEDFGPADHLELTEATKLLMPMDEGTGSVIQDLAGKRNATISRCLWVEKGRIEEIGRYLAGNNRQEGVGP
jgi:hypothetical protein